NRTCGLGAEVLATVLERARRPVAARRVTRPDTFVPCHFANQLEVLPSLPRILTAVAEMLGLELSWAAPAAEDGCVAVAAIGSGPADESVLVESIRVRPGQTVAVGDVVAVVEASKATIEVASPAAGVVVEVVAQPGATVAVGAALCLVRPDAPQRSRGRSAE